MIYLLLALLPTLSFAQMDVLSEKLIHFPNGKGAALVTIRQTDHPVGLPYMIEVRAKCEKLELESLKASEVSDATHVCDVKPQSPKLSPDGKAILVVVRDTDAERFNKQSRTIRPDEMGELKPMCQTSSREHRFNIEELCGRGE